MKQALRALLSGLACLLASNGALAVDPAGGPAVPPGMDPQDFVSATELPDASLEEQAPWMGQGTREPAPGFVPSASAHSPLLSVLALLLVVGLGGGALWLQRRKAKASPLGVVESKLTLLSSTRVGPKAFAVSAEVNGRVLLLGVTDHQVTNLGWLDPPELEASVPLEASEPEAAALESDELPDDYPGSALRAAARQASLPAGSTPQHSPLTSSHNLRRFQEVLRGALPSEPPSLRAPRVPRVPTPPHELLSRSSAPPAGSDAASTLAALTSDVLGGEAAPAGRSVAPASLRRKRQRRQELTTKPKAATKADPDAANSSLEGQVAGLRALKNG